MSTAPQITTPPASPNKYGGDPVAFDAAMQAFLDWMSTVAPQMNAQAIWLNQRADAVDAGAAAAGSIGAYVSTAAASAAAAAAARDAALAAWVASTYPAETLASVSTALHAGAIVKQIVCDTSKDSDGGAFRKRCAQTSWYTETIPSGMWLGRAATAAAAWLLSGAATGAYFQNSTDGLYYQLGASSPSVSAIRRGAARELPAMFAACIGAAGLSIYDLTQTNTPIWRFFPVGANEVVFATPTSVAYVNGKLVVATGSGVVLMDLIADSAVKISTAADSKYKGRIADATSGWN